MVVLAFVDIFLAVFHPTARAGPAFRVQSRATWRLVQEAGGCGGRPRGGILSLGAPVIAVLTPVAWLLLLILGFALVHYPFILDFHFSPGRPGPRWLEAFYYSGYVALWVQEMEHSERGEELFRDFSPFLMLRTALEEFLGEVDRELLHSVHGRASDGAEEADPRGCTLNSLQRFLCYTSSPEPPCRGAVNQ